MTTGDRCPKCNRPPCPQCARSSTVIGTRVAGEDRVRYLGCRVCGVRLPHCVEIVPVSIAPKQARPGRQRVA